MSQNARCDDDAGGVDWLIAGRSEGTNIALSGRVGESIAVVSVDSCYPTHATLGIRHQSDSHEFRRKTATTTATMMTDDDDD